MKTYPSILSSTGQGFVEIPGAYLFDKLDGRNVRVEWSRKRGWHKWGTRHHLFDRSDKDYAAAIDLFQKDYETSLTALAMDERWTGLTAFLELWQDNSLGGVFVEGEPFKLTLFDLSPERTHMLPSDRFLHLTDALGIPTARFLGRHNWTKAAVDDIRAGRLGLMGALPTFEGVVAKSTSRKKDGGDIIMAKAKTQAWIDAIRARFAPAEAEKLINS